MCQFDLRDNVNLNISAERLRGVCRSMVVVTPPTRPQGSPTVPTLYNAPIVIDTKYRKVFHMKLFI